MYIIGELINGMYKSVAKAIRERDKDYIASLAKRQIDAGCDALDLNCGPFSSDAEADLRWLVEVVQEDADVVLCLDSTKEKAILGALKSARNKTIINSSLADPEKLKRYLDISKEYNSSLIALLMDKSGVPQDKEKRLLLAAGVIDLAIQQGFSMDELYIDPILLPINVAQNQLFGILDTIKDIKLISDPAPKIIVGLSNISQGSGSRSLINKTFLVMAITYGLDSAILDPLDRDLMDSLITAELVLNKNIYCDSYLEAFRKSKSR